MVASISRALAMAWSFVRAIGGEWASARHRLAGFRSIDSMLIVVRAKISSSWNTESGLSVATGPSITLHSETPTAW